MATQYRENPAGIRAMLAAPFMVEALRRIGEQGKSNAERNTPVDTGLMKASWRVTAGVREGRAHARIFNTAFSPQGAPYPWFLEVGTRYIKRRRILGRALDELNLRP